MLHPSDSRIKGFVEFHMINAEKTKLAWSFENECERRSLIIVQVLSAYGLLESHLKWGLQNRNNLSDLQQ